MNNTLKGLLLVGGKSTRMGTSKAQLSYRDNLPEWRRITKLMEPLCDSVYVCCPKEQAHDFSYPLILDTGEGPLAAISEAFQTDPASSWLVIACDLPLLDEATLTELVSQRDHNATATYYRSVFDGKPEPLCAIYENKFNVIAENALKNQQFCPRNLLLDQYAKSLKLTNPLALKNANTPAEKLEVEAILHKKNCNKIVKIRYYGQLREITDKDSESVSTQSITPSGLYEELQIKYQFPHKKKQLMVAINEDFSTWETNLKEGDEVVFLPPASGG